MAWSAHVINRAHRFLKAAAAGESQSAVLAHQLAEAAAEQLEPLNRLVVAILSGGPFTVRRGLELAEVVLKAGHGEEDAQEDTGTAERPGALPTGILKGSPASERKAT